MRLNLLYTFSIFNNQSRWVTISKQSRWFLQPPSWSTSFYQRHNVRHLLLFIQVMQSVESDHSIWEKLNSASKLWMKSLIISWKTSPKFKIFIPSMAIFSMFFMTRTITSWLWVTLRPPKIWLITWAKIILNWLNMPTHFIDASH